MAHRSGGDPTYLQCYSNKNKCNMQFTYFRCFGKHLSLLPYGYHSHIVTLSHFWLKCSHQMSTNSSLTCPSHVSEIGQDLDTSFQCLNHEYCANELRARISWVWNFIMNYQNPRTTFWVKMIIQVSRNGTLTLVLLNLDMPCLCKQCRFRSEAKWSGFALFVIFHTSVLPSVCPSVIPSVNLF